MQHQISEDRRLLRLARPGSLGDTLLRFTGIVSFTINNVCFEKAIHQVHKEEVFLPGSYLKGR